MPGKNLANAALFYQAMSSGFPKSAAMMSSRELRGGMEQVEEIEDKRGGRGVEIPGVFPSERRMRRMPRGEEISQNCGEGDCMHIYRFEKILAVS